MKKSNMPDANLKVRAYKHEEVRQAVPVPGAARKAIDAQVGSNGNPKRRPAAVWGMLKDNPA